MPPKPPTRDELADLELQSLLQALSASDPDSRSRYDEVPSSTTSSSTTTTTSSSSSSHPPLNIPPSKLPHAAKPDVSETTFPTTMNCLDAFDKVWYCYTLGGQFLNVYRYGHLRDCSSHLTDWRFCMRAKAYSPDTRRSKIAEHYMHKAAEYKKPGGSSEDVWRVRREPVVGAFGGWRGGEGEGEEVIVEASS
ncbi:hypothetical protein DFH27DRAFT_623622 [Peziza echinospora]|nr:hypothetical protein DFH27DRAFT_623622 [Peziza echinospora]